MLANEEIIGNLIHIIPTSCDIRPERRIIPRRLRGIRFLSDTNRSRDNPITGIHNQFGID